MNALYVLCVGLSWPWPDRCPSSPLLSDHVAAPAVESLIGTYTFAPVLHLRRPGASTLAEFRQADNVHLGPLPRGLVWSWPKTPRPDPPVRPGDSSNGNNAPLIGAAAGAGVLYRLIREHEEQRLDGDFLALESRTALDIGELQTRPVDPVFAVLVGNAGPQARREAMQTLALLGVTSAIHVLRRVSEGPPGRHHGARRIAQITEDLLQPDEESATQNRVRPPYFFTLGFDY